MREELQWIENDVSFLDFRIFTKTVGFNGWQLKIIEIKYKRTP